MIQLTQIEIFKLFRRTRAYISFVVMLVIILLLSIGVRLEGEQLLEFILKPIESYFTIQGNLINAYLVSYVLLNSLWVHIPILLVIVTADLISGEHESGSIRMLLYRNISRNQLILSKFIASVIYVLCFMIFLFASMLTITGLFFGWGDLIVLVDGIQLILENEVLGRFAMATSFGALAMIAFCTLSLFVSSVTQSSILSILISLGVLVLSTLLHTFSFGPFEQASRWLFTHHMANWQLFFVRELPWWEILGSLGYLMGMTVVLLLATLFQYKKLQITS